MGISITPSNSEPSGSIWSHILNGMSGGLFGKDRKEDPTEYHNRRTDEEMPEGHGTGASAHPQHDQQSSTQNENRSHESVTHPVLKTILSKLNEKDGEAPMGGGKGRYTGMKKA